MPQFITKYFHDAAGNRPQINLPATEEQLLKLEKELEINLPADYKDFLRVNSPSTVWQNDGPCIERNGEDLYLSENDLPYLKESSLADARDKAYLLIKKKLDLEILLYDHKGQFLEMIKVEFVLIF